MRVVNQRIARCFDQSIALLIARGVWEDCVFLIEGFGQDFQCSFEWCAFFL
jgi:hypothetical protein